MKDISKEILSFSGEAALLLENGRASYGNAPALKLFGASCIGSSLAELLGETASQVQAPTFVIEQRIKGRSYTIRVSCFGDSQVVFVRPSSPSHLLMDHALIYSLKADLMNFSLAASTLQERSAAMGDPSLEAAACSAAHSYYKMLRVLNNASAVLGAEEGSLPFFPILTDMDEFLSSLVELTRFLRPDVEIRLEESHVGRIAVDRKLVELLMMNLVSNCLKHAKGLSRISIGTMCTKDSFIVSVSDDGQGIAPEELSKVFDRYKHSYDLTNIMHGAGLGLTVARSLANIHQGALLMESRVGIGTTVRFSLSRKLLPAQLCASQPPWQADLQSTFSSLADCLGDDAYSDSMVE